jgi:glycosyltransferase involved in cell wall biosynthesis
VTDPQPRFTVVVPTRGRETLRGTLRSIKKAGGSSPDVEVLVVADGPQPSTARIFEREALPTWRYFEHGPTQSWGNAQRTFGIEHSRGEWLLFMDDDDVYRPGAFDAIRDGTAANPGRVIVFRMNFTGVVIWGRPELYGGGVSTQMFVVPNTPAKLGSWLEPLNNQDSDYQFITQTVALQGEPVWRTEVIATIRPLPWWRVRAQLPRLRKRLAVGSRLRALRGR